MARTPQTQDERNRDEAARVANENANAAARADAQYARQPYASRTELENDLRRLHPEWTEDQIVSEANSRGASGQNPSYVGPPYGGSDRSQFAGQNPSYVGPTHGGPFATADRADLEASLAKQFPDWTSEQIAREVSVRLNASPYGAIAPGNQSVYAAVNAAMARSTTIEEARTQVALALQALGVSSLPMTMLDAMMIKLESVATGPTETRAVKLKYARPALAAIIDSWNQ